MSCEGQEKLAQGRFWQGVIQNIDAYRDHPEIACDLESAEELKKKKSLNVLQRKRAGKSRNSMPLAATISKGNSRTASLWRRIIEIVCEPKSIKEQNWVLALPTSSFCFLHLVGITAFLNLMFSLMTFKESPCTLGYPEETVLELLGLCQGCRTSDTNVCFCLRSQRLFIIFNMNECVWSIFYIYLNVGFFHILEG